jgi:hypothetical protein
MKNCAKTVSVRKIAYELTFSMNYVKNISQIK